MRTLLRVVSWYDKYDAEYLVLSTEYSVLRAGSMLLRWLVNQYLREGGEGKVREMVAGLARTAGQAGLTKVTEGASHQQDSKVGAAHLTARQEPRPPNSDDAEFLPCDVVFVFALGIESGGLVDLLKGSETSRQKHGTEHAGKLAGREVVVLDGGVGQKAAARATAEAIKFYQPRWVISAGFAGGLTDELRRGHIVMAEEVVNAAGERITVDLRLQNQRTEELEQNPRTEEPKNQISRGLHVGRLVTVDSILREAAERRRLAEQSQAIACDMESFAVVETCRKLGVPCLVIRIISDAVDDELPPEIEHLLKQKSLAGKLGAAAGAVMKRFSAAKDLWKLREDALKASDRLAKFLVGVVDQLPTTTEQEKSKNQRTEEPN